MPRPPTLSSSARALRESIFSRLQGRLGKHGADGVPLHLGDTYLAPPMAAREALEANAADWRYGAPAGEAPLLDRARRKAARAQRARLGYRGQPAGHRRRHRRARRRGARRRRSRRRDHLPDAALAAHPRHRHQRRRRRRRGAAVAGALRRRAGRRRCAARAVHHAAHGRALRDHAQQPRRQGCSRARHLEQLAELARRHDLWVLADEVYEDLAYAAPHVSIAVAPRHGRAHAHGLLAVEELRHRRPSARLRRRRGGADARAAQDRQPHRLQRAVAAAARRRSRS